MSRSRWLVALLVPLLSCGYALVGRGVAIDPSIKRIGVPLFKNATGKPRLDQLVTEKVIEELLKRGRFDVVQDTVGVDALVDGQLTSYRVVPVGFEGAGDAGETQATRYAIVLSSRVVYSKVGETEPIWSHGNFQVRDEYDLGDDPQEFLDREDQAIERLASSYASRLVATMLEAF